MSRISQKSVEIEVVPLDDLVRELKLERVDFIKMDIEGAERHALAGARETLRSFRPRLMLDSYHRPDDMTAFRDVIRGAVPSYQYECVTCESQGNHLVPHVTFWW